MPEAPAGRPRVARRWLRLIMAFLIIGAGGLLYTVWIGSLVRLEQAEQTSPVGRAGPPAAEGLFIKASIVAVDLPGAEMRVRLDLQPTGNWLQGGTLSRPFRLRCGERWDFHFRAGQPLAPLEFRVPLRGSSFYYPEDLHRALIDISSNGPVLMLEIRGATSGYRFGSARREFVSAERLLVSLEVGRSPLMQSFAKILLGLQWTLALTGLGLTLTTLVGSRRAEPGHWIFLSLALVALPLLRSQMVGAPAIGIYLDFFGFLPCLATVCASLVISLLCWLRGEAD